MPFVKKARGIGYCKNCRKRYTKIHPTQRFCGAECKTQFHQAGQLSFGDQSIAIRLEVKRQLAAALPAVERRILAAMQTDQRTELAERLKAAISSVLAE